MTEPGKTLSCSEDTAGAGAFVVRALGILAFLLSLVLSPVAAAAAEWEDYQLGTVRFQVPADWVVERRVRDSEYAFVSPDGGVRLLAFWWLPDEPLLGYEDIVSNRDVTLNGKDALFIHSQMSGSALLQLAFKDTRESGEKFLVTLDVSGEVDWEFYNDLINRISFGSGPASPQPQPQAQAQPRPQAAADAPLGPEVAEPEGGFALSLPGDWTSYRSAQPGMHLFMGLSKDRQRLVLVASARPDGGRDALSVLEGFETLFYQETAVPQSIDYDAVTKLGGVEGRALQMTMRLFTVNGVRLPYRDGRVDLFRGGDTSRAYWMAVIRPLDASPPQEATLREIAGSFRTLAPEPARPAPAPSKPLFGAVDPAPGKNAAPAEDATAADPGDTVVAATPEPPAKEVAPDSAPDRASDVTDRIRALTQRSIDRTRAGIDAPEVAVVPEPQADAPPPQKDGGEAIDVTSRIRALTQRSIDRTRAQLEDPEDPEAPSQEATTAAADPPKPEADTGDSIASRILAIRNRTLDRTRTDSGSAAAEDPAPPAADIPTLPPAPALPVALDPLGTGSILPGDLADLWRPYTASGGDFEAFGTLGKDGLTIDVPEGHDWAVTGVMSDAPVLFPPTRDQAQRVTLTFAIAPQEGTGLVFALVPSTRRDKGHWQGHDLYLVMTRKPDEPAVLKAFVNRKEVAAATITGDALPAGLVLGIAPDGAFDVTDDAGRQLLFGVMDSDFSRDGWHVVVASHAPKSGAAVKLSLTDLVKGLAPLAETGDPAAFVTEPQTTVLFDGTHMGRLWQPYRVSGGDFQAMARLADGALRVDIPEEHGWALVGIRNSDAVIWPDRLTGDGHVDLDFEFDASQTDGFAIALSAKYTLNGNKPPNERFLLHWRKTAEGIKASASGEHKHHLVEATAPDTIPEKVRVQLLPDGVRVVAEGFPDEVVRWKQLASGQGLRLYVFTLPSEQGAAARMALKSVTMTRVPGVGDGSLILPPGVSPLPRTALFEGAPTPLWEPASVSGAKFEDYGRFEGGKMIAEVPAKFSWGKTGLLSAEPVVVLDHRAERTPYEIRLKVDPALTSGMQVMVSSRKEAAMWSNASAAFSLIRHTDSIRQGDAMLGLSHGPYKSWSRQVDEYWLDEKWDGTVILRFGQGWAEIALPGGPSVRGTQLPIGFGSKLYMTVYAHPEHSRGGSTLALERIDAGWATPQRMTPAEAIMLRDDEDFDPEAFLDALAGELGEE